MTDQRPQGAIRCGGRLLVAGLFGGSLALAGCTPDQFFAQSVLVSRPPPLVRLAEPSPAEPSAFASDRAVVPASHAEPEVLPVPKERPETLPTPQEQAARGITLDEAINTTLLADPKI